MIKFENPELKAGIVLLLEKGKALIEKVKMEYGPIIDSILSQVQEFKEELGLNIFGEEVDVLTLEQIRQTAKTYLVSGANQVVALRQEEDESIFVYLTYAINKELLPKEQNKYVILKANKLDNEVAALFNESELIILK